MSATNNPDYFKVEVKGIENYGKDTEELAYYFSTAVNRTKTNGLSDLLAQMCEPQNWLHGKMHIQYLYMAKDGTKKLIPNRKVLFKDIYKDAKIVVKDTVAFDGKVKQGTIEVIEIFAINEDTANRETIIRKKRSDRGYRSGEAMTKPRRRRFKF